MRASKIENSGKDARPQKYAAVFRLVLVMGCCFCVGDRGEIQKDKERAEEDFCNMVVDHPVRGEEKYRNEVTEIRPAATIPVFQSPIFNPR